MTKYQLQASNKWSFDFIKESPITYAGSQFKWEATTLNDLPKFYHHIAQPLTHHTPGAVAANVNERTKLFSGCENICPLSRSISSPSMIIQSPMVGNKRKIVVTVSSTSESPTCNNQRKITGEFIKNNWQTVNGIITVNPSQVRLKNN